MKRGAHEKPKSPSPPSSQRAAPPPLRVAMPMQQRPIYVPLPPAPPDALSLAQSSATYSLSLVGRGRGRQDLSSFADSAVSGDSTASSSSSDDYGAVGAESRRLLDGGTTPRRFRGDSKGEPTGTTDLSGMLSLASASASSVASMVSDAEHAGRPYSPSASTRLLPKRTRDFLATGAACDAIVIVRGGGETKHTCTCTCATDTSTHSTTAAEERGSSAACLSCFKLRDGARGLALTRARQVAAALRRFRLDKGAVMASPGKVMVASDAASRGGTAAKRKKSTDQRGGGSQASEGDDDESGVWVPAHFKDATDAAVFSARIVDARGNEVRGTTTASDSPSLGPSGGDASSSILSATFALATASASAILKASRSADAPKTNGKGQRASSPRSPSPSPRAPAGARTPTRNTDNKRHQQAGHTNTRNNSSKNERKKAASEQHHRQKQHGQHTAGQYDRFVVRVTLLQPTLFFREQALLHNAVAPLAPDLPFPEATEDLRSCHRATLLCEFLSLIVEAIQMSAAREQERSAARARAQTAAARGSSHPSEERPKASSGLFSFSSLLWFTGLTKATSSTSEPTITVCATHNNAQRDNIWRLGRQWWGPSSIFGFGGRTPPLSSPRGSGAVSSKFNTPADPPNDVCSLLRVISPFSSPNNSFSSTASLPNNTCGPSPTSAPSVSSSASSLLRIAERPLNEYFGADTMHYFAYMNFFHAWLALGSAAAALLYATEWIANALTRQEGDVVAGHMAGAFPATPAQTQAGGEDSNEQYSFAPFYSIFTIFSSILFVKLWERRVATLSVEFSLNSDETSRAPVRKGFYGTPRPSPITGQIELHYSSRRRALKQLASWALTLLLLLFGLFVQLCSINLQGYMNTMSQPALEIDFFDDFSDEGALFDSNGPYAMVPVVLHVFVVLSMNEVFRIVSDRLTRWENYKTDAEATTAMAQKRLIFEFANNFCFLFYVAFYRFDMPMLSAELQSLFWMDQLRRLATETAGPYAAIYRSALSGAAKRGGRFVLWLLWSTMSLPIRSIWRFITYACCGLSTRFPYGKESDTAVRRRRRGAADTIDATAAGATSQRYTVPKRDETQNQSARCDSHLQEADNFDDYLEMTMQFGYVTLFAAAFPLGRGWCMLSSGRGSCRRLLRISHE